MTLSVIMPFAHGGLERTHNFELMFRYIAEVIKPDQLIVSEQGRYPTAFHKTAAGADYVFSCLADRPFSKGVCFNTALHQCRCDNVFIWDADCYISRNQVLAALSLLAGGLHCVIPYGRAYALSPESSCRITDWATFTPTDEHRSYRSVLDQPGVVGGVQCFRTAVIRHVRGFDERFCGYSDEDNEIVSRVVALGFNAARITTGDLYHRYHPKATSIGSYYDNTANNRAILLHTLSMSRPELAAAFGISEGVGNYSEALARTGAAGGERGTPLGGAGAQ